MKDNCVPVILEVNVPKNLNEKQISALDAKSMRKAEEAEFGCPEPLTVKDNIAADKIDQKLSDELAKNSEVTYTDIAEKLVETSSVQLKTQNQSKTSLKKTFTIFFIVFISVQYLVLIALMFIKTFLNTYLRDTVLLAYISSVFVETLGAIILMIKYAFDSNQEINILNILNGVIKNFQKFQK